MTQGNLLQCGARRCAVLLTLLTVPVLVADGSSGDWSHPDNLPAPPSGALGFPSRAVDLDVLPGFHNPPDGYGEVPFWWWTGDPLDKDRLLWQIEELHKKGIPGMQINYAHQDTPGWPTYPAEPEVFSEEWWGVWNWIVGECRKRNMGIGLSGYTLDWPGKDNLFGRLLYSDVELNGFQLAIAQKVSIGAGEPAKLDIPSDVVAILAHRREGDTIRSDGIDLTNHVENGQLQWTPEQGSWQVYVFCARIQASTLNPLHPQAGQKVIERFLQPCQDHAPGGSSKGLNYFFQDELQFGVSGRIWTPGFDKEFRDRKGYDLLPVMAALFEDIGPITPKIRMDYEDVKIQLMEERYFKPIFNWHWSRGLIYGCDPGSRGLNPEEFGDYFRCVRWYTAPGHDTPGGHADLIKGKVSSSISHLYHRPRVWLEGYHSLGWGATPATLMKATCENYLYGCTLLNLHGLYYTTHGSFWEWAPPCYHFRMPYWDHMGVFLKYFERLSYLLSQGVHCCDVAIMYPVAPFQAGMGGPEATSIAFDTGRRLMPAGIDWDFMDFQSLARAEVRDGRLHVSGESYRVLILPAMQAARWSTLQKALEFRRGGGIVIAVGALPRASDRTGRDDPELDALVKELFAASGVGVGLAVDKPEQVPAQIERLIGRDVQSTPAVMSLHRRVGDRDVYMVMGAAKGSECLFRTRGRAALWDPWTGGIRPVQVISQTDEGTKIRMPLEEYEAQVIVFGPGQAEVAAAAGEESLTATESIALDGPWEFELKSTLDNRWGDFRLPVDQTVIGPEARIFRYAEERGSNPGWQASDFDDSSWPRVTHGFGTQFLTLGPLPAGGDPAPLESKLAAMTEVDSATRLELGGSQYSWSPYAFSWRWGFEGDPGHQGFHGLKENVTDDFLCLGKPQGGHNETVYTKEDAGTRYYLWTCAIVDADVQARVITGGLKPAAVYLSGRAVQASDSIVSLRAGRNPLLLRYDEPGRGHFVLERVGIPEPGERTPLAMSWYDRPGVVRFDPRDDRNEPVGWYRFVAAPGLRAMTVRCRGALQAWADGRPMRVQMQGESSDGSCRYRVTALEPIPGMAKIALRIEQQRGFSGGAALPEPVELECGPGLMAAGDWSPSSALECYSGGAWYRRTVSLTSEQARGRLSLNLGDVAATAEVRVNGKVAGIRVTPPWVVDVSEHVKPGENRIEVLVYNTLANHYLTIPTRYRGSLRSGLIGPIRLEIQKLATSQQAADQHSVIGVAATQTAVSNSPAKSDHWFSQAGLGMFVHWGLASIPGNLDLSWGMMKNTPWDASAKNANKLTPVAYFALAEQFNPTNYHPDRWLKAAKEAGFGYVVLTTRHHDGFALWPSKHGDFNVGTYLGGRDLIREYVDACRRQGLKVGFYYSPPDWHFDRQYRSFGYGSKGTAESPHLGLNHEPVQLPERPADLDDRYVAYVNGQIEELLTWYGPIDYLWFDGSAGPDVLSIEQIRKLQPGIIVNDRQHGGGDVVTSHYEYQLPDARPAGWWEHCFSMVGAWGYTKPERCAPASLLISKMARVRAWGGNVLANYGPRPDGEMPDCFYKSMAEMKAWMDRCGTSLVNVEPGPYPDKCSVPVTVRGQTWFAHLLPATSDGPASEGAIVLTGVAWPKRVAMLAAGKELAAKAAGDKLMIEVPKELRTESDDVVVIEW